MMDIDSIPYGLDFRKHIKEALKRCDLMLAVIGPRWAAPNEQGQSRLVDETDWIRIEIEAALTKDIPVIPVLVNGAVMPKPKDLPETMQNLAFRQAAPLDMRRDFHAHMDRLIGVMDELLRDGAEQASLKKESADVEPDRGPAANAGTPAASSVPKAAAAKADIQLAQEARTRRARPPKLAQPSSKPTVAPERSLLQRLFVPDAERREAQSAVLARNWWMIACRGALVLALGFVWLLGDTGYLDSLDMGIFVRLYVGGLLIFLLLDGALAIASGWRGARPHERFVPLILNGVVVLLLGVWVALQRLGVVRIPTDTGWPPIAFWMDVGIGFMLAGTMLLAAAPGLSMHCGRLWLIAVGIAFAAAGAFIMLSPDYAWVGDMLTGVTGALLLGLALQLLARNKEKVGRA